MSATTIAAMIIGIIVGGIVVPIIINYFFR